MSYQALYNTSISIAQYYHCLGLCSLCIAQHQHYLALALHSFSSAQLQHCVAFQRFQKFQKFQKLQKFQKFQKIFKISKTSRISKISQILKCSSFSPCPIPKVSIGAQGLKPFNLVIYAKTVQFYTTIQQEKFCEDLLKCRVIQHSTLTSSIR